MSDPGDDKPLSGLDDLLAPFHDAEKPRARWRIGAESEKFGVVRAGTRPLPFEGEPGIRSVLAGLADRHGWSEDPEIEGGELIALRRGDAAITLEPGGQLELSGAPHETIHEICVEFRSHMAELHEVGKDLDVAWLGLGFHPFATQADLPWVPKLRYAVMREYLPTRGSMALDMMRRTATVQANLDYASEDDAMTKLRVALRLQPIVTAMFANSPFVEGVATGERSHRARVWLDVDPDRSGLLPFAWHDRPTYLRYVEWALDVPMFVVKREGKALPNTKQTFRQFMKDGAHGTRATMTDWETHLNTLFPETRIKKTLEVRGADSQKTDLICALPALWKGILYEPGALAKAEQLAERFTYDDVEKARPQIADRAMRARVAGREIAEWASEVLEVAWGGLVKLGNLNGRSEDETIHLKRTRDLVSKGMSPADELLERIDLSRELAAQLYELVGL